MPLVKYTADETFVQLAVGTVSGPVLVEKPPLENAGRRSW